MTGKDFLAVRRLATKDDETLALAGETCERVPASSLPHLLNSGHIVPATAIAEPAPIALAHEIDAPSADDPPPAPTEARDE